MSDVRQTLRLLLRMPGFALSVVVMSSIVRADGALRASHPSVCENRTRTVVAPGGRSDVTRMGTISGEDLWRRG